MCEMQGKNAAHWAPGPNGNSTSFIYRPRECFCCALQTNGRTYARISFEANAALKLELYERHNSGLTVVLPS